MTKQEVLQQIILELARSLELLNAPAELKGAVNGFSEKLEDEEVLARIHAWNNSRKAPTPWVE